MPRLHSHPHGTLAGGTAYGESIIYNEGSQVLYFLCYEALTSKCEAPQDVVVWMEPSFDLF
jgi:hypothetical protein